MMDRADRLRRITAAEDAARDVRNELKGYELRPMTALEGYKLADAVANGLQAIREML
jgi:hypothetical protein